MKTDLHTRTDIEKLVATFYERVRADRTLGPLFQLAPAEWDQQLPQSVEFWETSLFKGVRHLGLPLEETLSRNKKTLTHDEFDRWLMVFDRTVSDLFEGPNAEDAKNRATLVTSLMAHSYNGAIA